jgi:hypothetical protein
VLIVACAEDAEPIVPADPDASTSTTPDPSEESGDPSDDDDAADPDRPDSGKKDTGAADSGGTCSGSYEAPNLNGSGPCGTIAFGEPAASFGPVDPNAGTTYDGTELADGIYDAINAERASGSNKGSWRETFVVKGNRFTRVRQVDTGSGGGVGPISYRSGTFAYDTSGAQQLIKLTYDCAKTGDAGATPADDNLPSDAVVSADCSARFRFGASGIRITLRRR